jgi:predicted Zn-dependent peptidase
MIEIPHTRHRLANRLQVVLSPDPSVPVVAVNLWYRVGSRDERPGRTGSTWLDRTNYYQTLPANYVELGLWLESDRLGWLLPAMTQEKLDNQRDVVKNERRWRVDNQPYGDWDERLQAMVYPEDHPYHHSVIGSMEDLDAASLEDVETFFSTYYRPDNAVLTLCGDFQPDRALELVEKWFGPIPAGNGVPPIPGRTEIPTVLEAPVRAVVEQDISLARVYRAFRIPPYGHDAWYPAAVAAHVLAFGQASRLSRRLVRERRLAQDVVAYAFPITVGAAMLVVWATARPGVNPDALEGALEEELAALAYVSDAEVTRAVRLIEARHLDELQRVGERADQLSMFTCLFDDPGRLNTELDRIRAVTAGDVRAFAARHLAADHAATLVYVPAGATA